MLFIFLLSNFVLLSTVIFQVWRTDYIILFDFVKEISCVNVGASFLSLFCSCEYRDPILDPVSSLWGRLI